MKKYILLTLFLVSSAAFSQITKDSLIYTTWENNTYEVDQTTALGFGMMGGAAITINGNVLIAVSDFKVGKLPSHENGHKGQTEIMLIKDKKVVSKIYYVDENCILLPGTEAPDQCLTKKKVIPIFRG